MSLRTPQVLLIAAGILCGLSALADPPWKDESGQGYYQEGGPGRGHSHETGRDHRKKSHGGHYDRQDQAKDRHEDRNEYSYSSGPPPWAPAYGYRRKQRDDRRVSDDDRDDRDAAAARFSVATDRIGISSGRCNREVVGTVVGGVVGGVIGHNVAHAGDKDLGTVAGALIGAVVGNQIGRNMDNADVNCADQVLERAPDGRVVRWRNPENSYRYSITPYRTYRRTDGRYCRDYIAVVMGNETSKYREVACRTDNGIWREQSSVAVHL